MSGSPPPKISKIDYEDPEFTGHTVDGVEVLEVSFMVAYFSLTHPPPILSPSCRLRCATDKYYCDVFDVFPGLGLGLGLGHSNPSPRHPT